MKIIHAADLHLGTRFKGKLPEDKSAERANEHKATFTRLISYAAENGVDAVIFAGDIFDRDIPFKNDKRLVFDAISAHPEMNFFYLRGNHDLGGEIPDGDYPNLFTFTDSWKSYTVGDVTFTGIESTAENITSRYSTLCLDEKKKNIVIMHGAESDAPSGRDDIVIKKLGGKYIDYLALGHYHSYKSGKIDDRGVFAYSGCLEGRGFDECGEKGFVLLDTDTMTHVFVPFSARTLHEITLDVSHSGGIFEAIENADKAINVNPHDILRVILKGDVDFDDESFREQLESRLALKYYFVNVKDETARAFDIESLKNDLSLQGVFTRKVLLSDEYTDTEKKIIISLGIKAMRGDKNLK